MQTLRNASVPSAMMGRPGGGIERVDIVIGDDGIVASIAPHAAGPGRDLDGGLVLPALVDIHTHLDKGHIWPRRPNEDGTWENALIGSIADSVERWSTADVERRMDFALRCAYAHGTAAIRTHIESTPPQHDVSWAVFEAMRERWAGRVELQAVSLVGPDTLLDKPALKAVAERVAQAGGLIGGAVRTFPRSREAMHAVIEAAGNAGADIDIHADEIMDPASNVLLSLAEAVIETGYKGRVLAGHCCALAVQDEATQQRTIETVARAGVAVVSLPLCNIYLMDRNAAGGVTPTRRGVTLIHELRAAGVPVAIASDNTRDPFYAYGDLDALEVLREGARILHFDHPQAGAWQWARSIAGDAAAIANFDYAAEIRIGAPADLLLFRARNWTELLSRPQADREVLRNGVGIDTTLPDYRELDDLMES
ncbi:MAG: cytosine deaminase [Hyphomicrobiales bacterium]|nr:MAG: cytosine deaminase [Hyphomicrobiales bacterium]